MPPPRLTFHGAAGAVTGSCFRLTTDAGEVVGWASRHRALGACHDLAGVLAAIPADPDATAPR
mgnify:CR=1 FL=1